MKPPEEKSRSSPLKIRGFPALNAAFLCLFTNVSLMYLYPLALEKLYVSPAQIGIVMGVFSMAAVAVRPFLGLLIQRTGEGSVIFPGLALATAAGLCYPFLDAFGPLMITVRVLHGVGFSAFIAGGFSIAARSIPSKNQGEAFSFIGAAITGAVAFAPPAGEALIRAAGFDALYIAAVSALPAAASFCRAAIRNASLTPPVPAPAAEVYRIVLAAGSFLPLLVVTWCFSHSQSTVLNFLALAAEQAGSSGGKFFFLCFFTALITLLTAGRTGDRLPKVYLLRVFLPIMALSVAGIPRLIGSPYWPLPALAFGISLGMLFPVLNAMAAGVTPVYAAASMAVFTAVYDGGFITGPVLSGWMAESTTLPAAFTSAAFIVGAAFFVTLAAFRKPNP
ncbi:MAG TPA: MFS transporter [Desulfobacteraceae bacterium]|nr:MFS transporter [Desulfobacteraceae bacterium]